MFLLSALLALAPVAAAAHDTRVIPRAVQGAGRERVKDRWWESTAAMVRISPRGKTPFPFLEQARVEAALDDLLAQGIGAVEVFAPAEGGRSFGGLDTINRYRFEPVAGTLDDFKRMVRLAHARGMAVVSFDNLGYSSVEAVEFLKAADDVRDGRKSPEASFFVWSDSKDAPPPSELADRVFFVRPTHLPGDGPGGLYESSKHEYWEWSERARRFYWTKWGGEDRQGRKVRLPQYDWRSPAFQEEAKIIRFWMDTGVDGMVIDAVNWYIGCTWELTRRRMTDVIASYGNAYAQPEGAGAFREDPVAWITEGAWNSVQDYGLGIWWEDGTNLIKNAIDSGDPRPIEAALRAYHDRVVEAGGSLYYQPTDFDDAPRSHLALATLATLGSLIQVEHRPDRPLDDEARWLLKTKAARPALHQRSRRLRIPTAANDRHYAFLRTAAEGGAERVLVVLNFRKEAQEVALDLSGVEASVLVDLKTGERFARQATLRVPLAAFGYRLFTVARPVGNPS
jgi:Maltogenic Amylase, C-terminal domain/Alpha amylase, catalytic domain